jgi:uncharacterized protein (DUF983 family)
MNRALTRPCPSCGRELPEADADDFGWCEECREDLRRSARRGSHLVAALITVPFAGWILVKGLVDDLFQVLPYYAWLLPLAVAYYLGLRIGRELIRGYRRWKRTRGDS